MRALFFDLPWLDGEDTREWPLIERKKMLRVVALSESLFNSWDDALLFRDLATLERHRFGLHNLRHSLSRVRPVSASVRVGRRKSSRPIYEERVLSRSGNNEVANVNIPAKTRPRSDCGNR